MREIIDTWYGTLLYYIEEDEKHRIDEIGEYATDREEQIAEIKGNAAQEIGEIKEAYRILKENLPPDKGDW